MPSFWLCVIWFSLEHPAVYVYIFHCSFFNTFLCYEVVGIAYLARILKYSSCILERLWNDGATINFFPERTRTSTLVGLFRAWFESTQQSPSYHSNEFLKGGRYRQVVKAAAATKGCWLASCYERWFSCEIWSQWVRREADLGRLADQVGLLLPHQHLSIFGMNIVRVDWS